MAQKPYHEYAERLGPHQFRIVHLFPGQQDDPIRCGLAHRDLDDISEGGIYRYHALSYVWGLPAVTDTIYLDESPMVTVNLSCALHDLRLTDENIIIWAGALVNRVKPPPPQKLNLPIARLSGRPHNFCSLAPAYVD